MWKLGSDCSGVRGRGSLIWHEFDKVGVVYIGGRVRCGGVIAPGSGGVAVSYFYFDAGEQGGTILSIFSSSSGL